jgi:hypothetical protein
MSFGDSAPGFADARFTRQMSRLQRPRPLISFKQIDHLEQCWARFSGILMVAVNNPIGLCSFQRGAAPDWRKLRGLLLGLVMSNSRSSSWRSTAASRRALASSRIRSRALISAMLSSRRVCGAFWVKVHLAFTHPNRPHDGHYAQVFHHSVYPARAIQTSADGAQPARLVCAPGAQPGYDHRCPPQPDGDPRAI